MTDLTCEYIRNADLDIFRDILLSVLNDRLPPETDFFKSVVRMALDTYNCEPEDIRQKAADGRPGGLIDLRSDKPVILLPDLHARRDFFRNVLDYVPERYIPPVTDDGYDFDDDYDDASDGMMSAKYDEECPSDADEISAPAAAASAQTDDSRTSESETDTPQADVSVMDFVPPSDIDVCESSAENVKSEPDIADRLIEQARSIHKSITSLMDDDDRQDEDISGASSLSGGDDGTEDIIKEENHLTVLELLEQGRIIMLCIGDGIHGEAKFADRWHNAYAEFLDNFDDSPNMDAEIADSFNLMIAVMLLKIRFPKLFHFLKGNHENIKNETDRGNYAFVKFANEGQMVLTYFLNRYDKELLDLYAEFEHSLPLFAVGWNFLASHAEPASFYDFDHILNYHINEDVIIGLTWTDNYQSMPGTIDVMLDYYIPNNCDGAYYFGGHRPIKGLYNCINGDRYVQFHNPWLQLIGFINQREPIDLDRDIMQISTADESEGRS